MVKSLKKKGLYDNSIIIIYGDHGDEQFQKETCDHGSRLNEYQLGSMLYLKFPGMDNKRIINAPTSTTDILPTIVDYFNKEYQYNIVFPSIYKQQGLKGVSLLNNLPADRIVYSFQCANILPNGACITKRNSIIKLKKSFNRSEIE